VIKHIAPTTMKLLSFSGTILAFTSLSSLASATINLTFPFFSVTPGQTYELAWTQDTNYVSSLSSDSAFQCT